MSNSLAGMSTGQGEVEAASLAPNNLAAPPAAPGTGQAPMPAQKQVHIDEAKQVLQKQAAIDRALRGVLKEPGPVPRKKIVDMAVDLVAERVISAQAMAGYMADLPEDPVKIREWAAAHAMTVEKGLNQLIDMMHGATAPPAEGAMQ